MLPESEDLHETVYQLVIMYTRDYNVVVPPINMPLMLFQFIRQLSLPCEYNVFCLSILEISSRVDSFVVEIYTVVRRLQQFLDYGFTFLSRKKRAIRAETYPEAQLLSLIIIATKLLFPFDKSKGYPASPTEPAAQVVDWKLWMAAQKRFENLSTSSDRLPTGHEVVVNEGNVFHMTEGQLDDYLDWYQNTWLSQSKGQC